MKLVASYATKSAGIENSQGSWRVQTVHQAQQHDVVRRFIKSFGLRAASDAGAETLAVIAYKQPVTSPEISEIRG